MPYTLLGKRTRSAAVPVPTTKTTPTSRPGKRIGIEIPQEDALAASTRPKRRTAVNEPNDENQNPFVLRRQDGGERGEETEVDVVERPKKKTRQSARSAPANHEALESRVEVEATPATVASHFKVTKSVIGIYQDGKDDREKEKENTPKTPRHRDALLKKVPITPQHRLLASRVTPRSARTPVTPSAATVYSQARQLFSRCSDPGKLIGRDSERAKLSTFVQSSLESTSTSTGCLYVSGPPGTGKSALLNEIIEEHTTDSSIPVSVVNCMSVRNSKDLSRKLSDDLDLREDAGFEHLKSVFVRGRAKDKKKYLVVLDEVDVLVDLDLALLYNLFEWSMQPTSRLVLIGIANALDLTDRFLPRLKARNLKPELLPFMPYSAVQIAEVITSKLKGLAGAESSVIPFLYPAAIQFCAKKVAAQTGDLRKAFDICKRAVDLVDQETWEKDLELALQNSPSKTPLMENVNLSSPASPRKKGAYTMDTAPKVTIAHMAKVTAQVFSNGATQRLSSLNLQQKAVLCALAALEKRKRETQVDRIVFATPSKTENSAPSVKQLFEAYTKLCKRDHVFHPLSSIEFRDVVSGLETLSLLTTVDGKKGSFANPMTPSRTPGRPKKSGFAGERVGDERRVASAVGMKELNASLEGPGGELLREMLEDGVLA